jgi:hypothetical protein
MGDIHTHLPTCKVCPVATKSEDTANPTPEGLGERMPYRRSWLAAALLALFAFLPAIPAIGASGCEIPWQPALSPSRDSAKGEPEAHELWLMNPDAQAAVDRLGAEYQELFGSELEALGRGFIGAAADHTSQTVFVVVDPEVVQVPDLESRLQRVVDDTAGAKAFPVRVVASCHSSSDLLEADRVILERTWHPAADEISFASSLDPHTSTWRVMIALGHPSAEEVGASLQERLGETVSVGYGEGGRESRA